MCNRSPEELNMWFYINTSLFERCTAHAGECGAVVRTLNKQRVTVNKILLSLLKDKLY
jgi:hypothetical protein